VPPRSRPLSSVLGCCILAACIITTGCQGGSRSKDGSPVKITISAASDLGPAFREIGALFEEETGIQTSFNFGSTGQLAQQIEQGAPVDLFAAADLARIHALEAEGLIIPDTIKIYALGRITLWTRFDNPLRLERVEDLLRADVGRVAIANPDHAPYGAAARQAMQTAGIWERVQDRLVQAENAQQALQYAETGNVDAAIVPLSLSHQGAGRWTLIPAELHRPIVQTLAVINGSSHGREARMFADFVTGARGQEVLGKYGFVAPTPRDFAQTNEEPVR
jgi:molybdate transport system substrate-binding protein